MFFLAPVQVSERVHRPIQVAVDDRNRQRVAEPVTSPHHSNFAARSKELREDEIGEAKKTVLLQNIENNESDTEIASPSRVSSTPTLDSVSQSSDLVDSAASLSSLSILDTGTTPPSSATPSSATPPSATPPSATHPSATPTNATPPSATPHSATPTSATPPSGASPGTHTSEKKKKKKKKSKPVMAIRFPEDKDKKSENH